MIFQGSIAEIVPYAETVVNDIVERLDDPAREPFFAYEL